MTDNIGAMLRAQHELQKDMPPDGRTPDELTGHDLADFILWNVIALDDELHEAMLEFKWKPWATGRGLITDRDAFIGEMVDAWHFFMNILLAVSPGHTPEEVGAEFVAKYYAKVEVNRQRQQAPGGYTGKKDQDGRALDEPTTDADKERLHQARIIEEHKRRQARSV